MWRTAGWLPEHLGLILIRGQETGMIKCIVHSFKFAF